MTKEKISKVYVTGPSASVNHIIKNSDFNHVEFISVFITKTKLFLNQEELRCLNFLQSVSGICLF